MFEHLATNFSLWKLGNTFQASSLPLLLSSFLLVVLGIKLRALVPAEEALYQWAATAALDFLLTNFNFIPSLVLSLSSFYLAFSPLPVSHVICSTKACWLKYWSQVKARQEKWMPWHLQAETELANTASFRFRLTARIDKEENVLHSCHYWQSGIEKGRTKKIMVKIKQVKSEGNQLTFQLCQKL